MAKRELLAQGRPAFQASNTSLAKIVQQSQKFGNPGIPRGQITHRHIYHYLPLAGAETFDFFKDVSTATQLFSNIKQNQLQVGEAMIIKEIFFDVITVTPGSSPPLITNQTTFEAAGIPGLYASQFQWTNDNQRVVKPIGLQQMNPKFNKNAFNPSLNVITLKSDITIQPLIDFVGTLSTPTYVPVDNGFIGCHIIGEGTILNPKTNY